MTPLNQSLITLTIILTIGAISCNQKKDSCQVSDPSGIVEQQKMDVLYKRIKNPVKVSVPGYCSEDIQVSLTNGNLTKEKPGHYTIEVNDSEKTKLSIVVKEGENQTKQIGEKTYHIKEIPEPSPQIAGKTSGSIALSKIKDADQLQLAKPEGLPIKDLTFSVNSYRLTYIPNKGDFKETKAEKAAFSDSTKKWLKNAKPGDRIIVDKIIFGGPKKGVVHDLSTSVNLKVATEETDEEGE